MMVWLSPFLPFMCTSASAPEPPGLLTGVNGTGAIFSDAMMLCKSRTALSAPPPLPAITTNSTGFCGSQAWPMTGIPASMALTPSAQTTFLSVCCDLNIYIVLLNC
jgi:hypothetical protein